MGQSDAPDLGYSMATYADDLAALLDALGVDEVVLVGLSMGGYVAFEFLRRWRDRVRALMLLDTRAEADAPEGRRARDAAAATRAKQGAAAVADAMLPKMLGRPTAASARPRSSSRCAAIMAATPVAGIVGALGAMRDRHDSTGLLADARRSADAGRRRARRTSLTPPDAARRMAAAIPGARLVVIPGAGHLPPLERPCETTAAIRDFLACSG